MEMYEYEAAWIMTAQLNEKKDGCELSMRPLVLCKDCKHHGAGTCSAAAGIAFPPPDEWFCADGEKRDGDA
jgi:hypothetical protein